MPKIILTFRYLRDAPPEQLENYVRYVSTREGVEKVEGSRDYKLACRYLYGEKGAGQDLTKAFSLFSAGGRERELARAAIKGLTFYAEQTAHQGNEEEIQQIRSLVDAISLYWGVDEKRDWTEEFDEKVQRAGEEGRISGQCSSVFQLKTVRGLSRYAEEMALVQGVEETDRILEIPNMIRRLGKVWRMSPHDIELPCHEIEETVNALQVSRQAVQGLGLDL